MEDGPQQPEVLATEDGRVSKGYKEGEKSGPHPLAQASGSWSFPSFFGKHRMQAAISHLNNQINIIQVNMISIFSFLFLY